MSSPRGIPNERSRSWQKWFAGIKLLPPFVLDRDEHPDRELKLNRAGEQEFALLSRFSFPVPGGDPREPWLFSWRVGEKQPQVKLERVGFAEKETVERVTQGRGMGRLVDAWRAMHNAFVVMATRCRIATIIGKPSPFKRPDLSGSRLVSINYSDVEMAKVEDSSLTIRSSRGDGLVVHWKEPGSGAFQLLLAASAAFGDDEGGRVVSAMAARDHGARLTQARVTFREAMQQFADDMQSVARASAG